MLLVQATSNNVGDHAHDQAARGARGGVGATRRRRALDARLRFGGEDAPHARPRALPRGSLGRRRRLKAAARSRVQALGESVYGRRAGADHHDAPHVRHILQIQLALLGTGLQLRHWPPFQLTRHDEVRLRKVRGAPRRRAAALVTVQNYFYQKDISDIQLPRRTLRQNPELHSLFPSASQAPRDAVGAGAAPSARLLGVQMSGAFERG
mmetsp:Transcript_14164/g.37521  ORF Transcript_14164/g.37521 Transcript_14164/m.37521 type:complete len:209 (+) Transcript_14164:699-1325(+)